MRVPLAQPRFNTLRLVKDLTKNTSSAFGSKKSWLQVDKAFKAPAYRGLWNLTQEQNYIQNLNLLSVSFLIQSTKQCQSKNIKLPCLHHSSFENGSFQEHYHSHRVEMNLCDIIYAVFGWWSLW